MANQEHVERIKRSVADWNGWRESHPEMNPDLVGANLSGAILTGANLFCADLSGAYLKLADLCGTSLLSANLSNANLSNAFFKDADLCGANLSNANLFYAHLSGTSLFGANLSNSNLRRAEFDGASLVSADLSAASVRDANLIGADLTGASLVNADLTGANLTGANLSNAALSGANLTGARLSDSILRRANLSETDLSGANLTGADLTGANLTGAVLSGANLTSASLVATVVDRAKFDGCLVYGLSAWDLKGVPDNQKNLVISPGPNSPLTVDNLKVAQFIYLLLYNPDIRDVIDTVTSKVVLILGRFTNERKKVLDGIRDALRQRGYVPVLFDFQPSASRDLTETITTLAGMARFIVADLTEPKSIPHELQSIVERFHSVPVQPLLLSGTEHEYTMFEHFEDYHWVLPIAHYDNADDLLANIATRVIAPAEARLSKSPRV